MAVLHTCTSVSFLSEPWSSYPKEQWQHLQFRHVISRACGTQRHGRLLASSTSYSHLGSADLMGAGQSTESSGASALPKRGLHVLRVTPGSPAADTNIEPFFDFVVGIEGTEQSIDASQLEQIVESHEGRVLNIQVWNSQTQETRGACAVWRAAGVRSLNALRVVVSLIPSGEWSQVQAQIDPKEPGTEAKPSLLGLSMRLCDPEPSLDNVWHVMDVFEGYAQQMLHILSVLLTVFGADLQQNPLASFHTGTGSLDGLAAFSVLKETSTKS
jgi:hypothetical protein